MRVKQADFFERDREVGPRRSVHGGTTGVGRRKVARPLDVRKPVHVVLKSSHAVRKMSLLSIANKLVIEKIVRERAEKYGVVIQGFELMRNHLHLIARFKSRLLFQQFLKTITGLIARHVTGARKGKPFGKRFFDELAFTRVVQGFKDLRGLIDYFKKNQIERDIHPLARVAIEKQESAARKAKAWLRRRSKKLGK